MVADFPMLARERGVVELVTDYVVLARERGAM